MKILLCIVLLLVVLTLFAVWPGKRRDALRAPFLGRNCAHRGFFGKDQRPPENSLPAFAAAAKNGYGIELDVQFTSDRRLVVFHDDTLDRMTPAKGFVHNMPWAEFSAQPLAGSDEHPRAEWETSKPRRRALRLLLFLFTPGDRPGLWRIAARAAERHGLDDGRREILRAVIENAVVR